MVARDHTLLKLLALVDELYVEEEKSPAKGKPPDYSELVMLKVFIVMVLKKIKHFITHFIIIMITFILFHYMCTIQ